MWGGYFMLAPIYLGGAAIVFYGVIAMFSLFIRLIVGAPMQLGSTGSRPASESMSHFLPTGLLWLGGAFGLGIAFLALWPQASDELETKIGSGLSLAGLAFALLSVPLIQAETMSEIASRRTVLPFDEFRAAAWAAALHIALTPIVILAIFLVGCSSSSWWVAICIPGVFHLAVSHWASLRVREYRAARESPLEPSIPTTD